MKATKLRETGRRHVKGDAGPEDEVATAPPVGDPGMPDVSADAIGHDTAAIDRALDEIAAGHGEGLSKAEVATIRRGALDRWDRHGSPAEALLPLWLEAKEHLSKGRPKGGSVAEGLPGKS